MADQGVTVINRSASLIGFDGPGDGTSDVTDNIFDSIDHSVDNGIVWVNSAGNYADQNWWTSSPSTSSNGFVYFDGSDTFNDVYLEAGDELHIVVRWDDRWGTASRDIDVCIFPVTNILDDRCAEDVQDGSQGSYPFEYIGVEILSSGYFAIEITHHSGVLPSWIQLQVRGANLEHSTARHSINNASESANSGMLAVGATHYWNTHAIANYSSRGPTPDGRIKPDIVGTACAATESYPPEFISSLNLSCWFPGTSQAAPHVAGLAALVKQANPSFTPQQVADYLKTNAAERGASGADYTWGHGFAQLPAPPAAPGEDPCVTEITGDDTVSGTWAAGCESAVAERGYARYYSFTLEQQAQVAIELESNDADTYLYLRRGDARSGGFIDEDDDTPDITRSEIVATLNAGSYTIEATTFDAGATGNFTLTVSGLGGTATGPDPGTGDACGEAITGDGSVSGTWAAGCQSQARSGSYARYYSFTLEQQAQVTIELESSDADTYLYLRSGDSRSGGFINEDDDTPDTTRSEIVETLEPGTYTIEATTFDAGATGGFTLTVTGLGGTATGPGPGPGTDACGESITGDGTTTGSWAAGCQSQARSGSYARYYSFTLEEQSLVTIELESSEADTYLYLRRGDSRSGGFIDEDDDTPDTTRSEIVASLDAGTYTIEATTFDAGATGNFTLTVSGLAGTATGPGPGPDPGTDSCGESITGDGEVSGTWASGCQSQERSGSYARYYSFTLEQQAQVTIELESSEADTYLYLRRGDSRSGGFIDEDDDTPDTSRSEIVASLEAGSYTIEATTFDTGKTGNFTLTVSGLGGTATGPGPGPDPGTDVCGVAITGDGPVSGTWAAGCESAARSGSYARYYSFTLEQQSQVTIELESSEADTYLYLRRGDARSGGFIDEDDDTPDTTRSEIVASLDAGTYTIEATTFDTGETGSFTLTVSGLGGTATGPGPDPGTDACAAVSLAGDGSEQGTWAADCQSLVTTPNTSNYGYARYYSFTTSEERDVTITLKSSVDPYLYIRVGDRNGSVEAQNDDHGSLLDTTAACASAAGLGTRDSCITIAGLAAGTYSIEATTYSPNETGSFILTVSGLSSG